MPPRLSRLTELTLQWLEGGNTSALIAYLETTGNSQTQIDHCLSYAGEMTAQEDETLESVIETEAIARKLRRIPEGFHRLRVFTQSDHEADIALLSNLSILLITRLSIHRAFCRYTGGSPALHRRHTSSTCRPKPAGEIAPG